MEQLPKHPPEQSARQRRPYGFQPGVSGNPRGRMSAAERRALIEAKAAELASEFGGMSRLSAGSRALIEQAATLLLKRPRNGEDHVRLSNSVARLLGAVARRHGGQPTRPVRPLSETLL